MSKLAGLGALRGTIGPAVVLAESFRARAGCWSGAIPARLGRKRCAAAAPAGMVPKSVSSRRIELGIIGSSQPPVGGPIPVRTRLHSAYRPL